MYKIYCRLLSVAVTVVVIGCVPHGTNVDTFQPANPDERELRENQCSIEQDCQMTIREKYRVLLLGQDYQGTLALMPQVKEAMLEEAMLEKEMSEKGMLDHDPVAIALRMIRFLYCYLYVALGRDEEALQKYIEMELPTYDDPGLVFMDSQVKIFLLKILNMFDEIIDESNKILDNPDIEPLLGIDYPPFYAITKFPLIHAQLAKGDFESAQNNIDQLRNYLQGYPAHIYVDQQWYSACNIYLSLAEYYISNLIETHTACFGKGEQVPPSRDPSDPKKLFFDLPKIGHDFISKTDGSLFTLEDFPEALAEPPRNLAPVLNPFADH